MVATFSKHIPWTLLFFAPILYFTLFDQPGFIPSARTFSVYLILLIFIPWLWAKVWHRRLLVHTPLDYPLLIIIVLHLASALLSASFRLTFYSLWLLVSSILTFYFMLDQLQAGREKFLWQAIFLVTAIVLELAVVEFVTWYFGLFPPLGFEISWPKVAGWTFPPVPRRLGLALLTVPIAPPFSGYVVMLIPAALGLTLSIQRLSIRLGFVAFIFFALTILALTFSRTGLVALAIGLIIFAGLSWYIRRLGQWKFSLEQTNPPSKLMRKWAGLEQKYFIIALVAVVVLLLGVLFFSWSYFANYVLNNRASSNEVRFSLIWTAILMWRDHPWLGVGPGLFGLFYKDYTPANSIYFISISAHSDYLQTLAETGLVGILAISALLIIGLRTAYKLLVDTKAANKLWRHIGVISSLAVFLTTAAIEHIWFLAFIVPFCFLAAYLFYRPTNPTGSQSITRQSNNWAGVWLPRFYFITLIVLAITLIYTNKIAERFLTIAAEVKPGQELAVAEEMRQLQNYDPGLPMYTIGRAYFQGKHVIATLQIKPCALPPANIFEADQTILTEAIHAYEVGLNPIKAHSIYWANLASLYWLNHQADAAQTALKQAIDLSDLNDPKIAFYLLNSGCYYELQGQTERAIATYARLLAHNPNFTYSPFWQASEFRATHLSAIIDRATQQQPTDREQLVLAIKMELARGNIETADALLNKLASALPDDPTTLQLQAQYLLRQKKYIESQALAHQLEDYQLLGEIALATSDTTTARINLEKAIFLNVDDTEAYYDLAQAALAEGHTTKAIAYLKRITSPFTPPTTPDARFVYGYPADFPIYPSLLLITPPPLQSQPFRLLSQLYRETGSADSAEQVEQALATYDPYLKN